MRLDNPMLIHAYTLWCVFKGPSTTFLDNSGLKEGRGVEKTPWNRGECDLN